MNYPNLSEEKKLWKEKYDFVIGLDEAGRGPLAGPVVAAAVCINRKIDFKNNSFLKKINDSKKLSAKKREELYKKITKNLDIKWGIGVVSEKIIDKINILEATKLAMEKALRQAQGKLFRQAQGNLNKKEFLILDGNFKINSKIPQKNIIKGDQKVLSIAMASIIAKVYRDKLMTKIHKKYPEYGFLQHKGYGTSAHYAMIKKHGVSVIHRKSFRLL